MGAEQQRAILSSYTSEQLTALRYDWRFWARPNQLPPVGDWRTWLILAGRGFGKTRTAGEWIRRLAESGHYSRLTLVGATASDVRDIMVDGESGILAISPPSFRPRYEPSKSRLTWPNGCVALLFSADEPERLRGKQHEAYWADELAAWRYAEAFAQLQLGLRIGPNPRGVVSTTPKPIQIVRDLIADPSTHVTRGRTYDNQANLAPAFMAQIIRRYEGTRLGRQELDAEVLDDVPGALWTRQRIEELRVRAYPDLGRIVVAIDPAVTSGEDSDETGIIVAGVGTDKHAYVLDDLTCRLSPDGWARTAVGALDGYQADRIIAEVNNGGDLVESTIRTVRKNVSYRAVRASRGKRSRAEPVAALYEQGRVHHVGSFAALEDQMCTFVPDSTEGSPDHVDALVWALTDLMLGDESIPYAYLMDDQEFRDRVLSTAPPSADDALAARLAAFGLAP